LHFLIDPEYNSFHTIATMITLKLPNIDLGAVEGNKRFTLMIKFDG